MGPQLYSCGNGIQAEITALTQTAASMGPQLYSCGNQNALKKHELAEYASMGPQLYSCGNPNLLF